MKSSHGYVAAVMTQTSDVENELNGMVTYDREVCKCHPEKLAKINERLLQWILQKKDGSFTTFCDKNWHHTFLHKESLR